MGYSRHPDVRVDGEHGHPSLWMQYLENEMDFEIRTWLRVALGTASIFIQCIYYNAYILGYVAGYHVYYLTIQNVCMCTYTLIQTDW